MANKPVKWVSDLFRGPKDSGFMNRTIFKYKDKWVYCRKHTSVYDATTPWAMRLSPMTKAAQEDTVNTTFEIVDFSQVPWQEVDFAKPEIGYVNYTFGPQYLKAAMQGPNTGGHVGLTTECIMLNGTPAISHLGQGTVLSAEFQKMLDDKYPTFKDAWDVVGVPEMPMRWEGCAPHRDFCLRRVGLSTVVLEYKGRRIGEWPSGPTVGALKLYPAFNYLERKIKESFGAAFNVTSTAN